MSTKRNPINHQQIADALVKGIDQYDQIARWGLQNNDYARLVSTQTKLFANYESVGKMLALYTVDQLESAIRANYPSLNSQLDWDAWKAVAVAVHNTLVPAAGVEIKSNEIQLLTYSFDARMVPDHSGTVSDADMTAMRAALQAVVDEYV